MSNRNIRELEEKIKYKFQNIHYLRQAMTHSSFANEHRLSRIANNERLELSLIHI